MPTRVQAESKGLKTLTAQIVDINANCLRGSKTYLSHVMAKLAQAETEPLDQQSCVSAVEVQVAVCRTVSGGREQPEQGGQQI